MTPFVSGTVSPVDNVNPRPPGAPDRAVVNVGPEWTVKRYRTEAEAAEEAQWYKRVPWAAPRLICRDGPDLILPTLPVAADFPAWRPVADLRALLVRLHAAGIHHRDVHTKNVVMGDMGHPLIIDWETAVAQEAALSYDMYGPAESGVSVPPMHERLGIAPQWWGSKQRYAIGFEWNASVL